MKIHITLDDDQFDAEGEFKFSDAEPMFVMWIETQGSGTIVNQKLDQLLAQGEKTMATVQDLKDHFEKFSADVKTAIDGFKTNLDADQAALAALQKSLDAAVSLDAIDKARADDLQAKLDALQKSQQASSDAADALSAEIDEADAGLPGKA